LLHARAHCIWFAQQLLPCSYAWASYKQCAHLSIQSIPYVRVLACIYLGMRAHACTNARAHVRLWACLCASDQHTHIHTHCKSGR